MFGKKKEKDSDLAVVRTASDNFEIASIKGLLEENDIPYIEKTKGSGGYLRIVTGMSIYGTDFIISKDNLERARDILAVLDINEEDDEELDEEDSEEYADEDNDKDNGDALRGD